MPLELGPGPHEEADGLALGPALLSGYPPASLRSSVQEDAVDVGAQAAGGALFQHVVAALLPANRLLVQPRAERDARHVGVLALQVGSWQRWERQGGAFQSTLSLGSQADPWEGLGHSLDLPELLQKPEMIVASSSELTGFKGWCM